MDDFDQVSFKYNGSKWNVIVTVCNVADNINVMLNNQNLLQLDFENSLNNLILTGSLKYIDEMGKLDKVLAESYTTCHVKFWKEKGDSPEDNTNFNFGSVDIEFEHEFIVLNINVTDRKKNKITYQLDLISDNWIKFNKKVKYTNYLKEKEPITDILKKLLLQVGFNIDVPSFDKNKSPVKIYYMTLVNDTIHTSMNYLLRRMYYDKDQGLEDAIKFLSYDMINNKIYLTNISKDTTFLSETVLPMSCFDSSIEDMTNESNILMASLNKVRRSDFFKTFEFHHIYKYDPEKNEIKDIKDTELDKDQMLNWFENIFDDSQSFINSDIRIIEPNRIVTANSDTSVKDKITTTIRDIFVSESDRWENYWNNDINIYDEHLNSLLYNDSLVLSIDGQLILNSGGLCGIKIDRNLEKFERIDGDDKDDIAWRFKKFEGKWIVARVRHLIYPAEGVYKTNITLSRNYTPVIKHN